MLTFTELQHLCGESIFLKYCGYFMPLLLFLLTKRVWILLTASHTTNTEAYRKAVIDHNQTYANRTANDKPSTDDDDGGAGDGGGDGDEYKPHLPEREHVKYRGLAEYLDKTGAHFYKLANDRRSIRKFAKDKAVNDSIIEKCILAAGK